MYIPLRRVPEGGDHFRWNGDRWRIRDVLLPSRDEFGPFREVEAVSSSFDAAQVFEECPGCEGIISCADTCFVGLHREAVQASAPRLSPLGRPKKQRPLTLDAPLRFVTAREGNTETLKCGHVVHYRFFKFVDKTATMRRCLECCGVKCAGVVRTVKRPRIP